MDKGKWANSLPITDVVEINGHSIYILHELEHLGLDPAATKLEMVIFGHTHKPALKEKDSVLYLNPGGAGPRRYTLPPSIAKVLVKEDGLIPEIITINI